MKNYLNFETEIKDLEGEIEKLKEPLAELGPEYYEFQLGIGKP